MIGFFLATSRMIWFGFAVIYYMSKYFLFTLGKGKDEAYGLEIRYQFVRRMNRTFGLRVVQEGNIPDSGTVSLIVCNHRNLIDPIIVLKFLKAFPVAKAEVEKYPFIGFGAKVTGVIFVKRENKTSRRNTRKAIAEGLKEGKSILIFPEGKVGIDETTDTFHIGSFEVAAAEEFPVIPTVLEYKNKGRDYWISGSLLSQYYKMFKNRSIDCHISFGEPLNHSSGEQLMKMSREWMNDEIRRIHQNWNDV